MPTPAEPGQPQERRVVEPIRVLRPRNTDALAELVREMTDAPADRGSYESIRMPVVPGDGEPETEELPPVGPGPGAGSAPGGDRDWAAAEDWGGGRGASGPSGPGFGSARTAGRRRAPRAGYASAAAASGRRAARDGGGPRAGERAGGAGPAPATGRGPAPATGRQEQRSARRAGAGYGVTTDTEPLSGTVADREGSGLRRAAVAIGVCAAALLGFAGALLVPGRGGEAAAETVQPPAPSSSSAPDTPSAEADPDGAGTLREGDSGAEVKDLQERLLRIPDVYKDGATDGDYNSTLTAAVARFQLWYGIRGDEDGVYGDDTRQALESRTGG